MASDAAKRALIRMAATGQAEAVTYCPADGTALAIHALVDRGGAVDVMEARGPAIVVTILNDAAGGRSAADLDAGADSIDVAQRAGGTAATRAIRNVVSSDADWITLTML